MAIVKNFIDQDDIPYKQGQGLPLPTEKERADFLASLAKKPMFTASSGIVFPEEYSFENEIGRIHYQVRNGVEEGTCYTESTTAYVEWWLWMKTGKKYEISDNEIRDIGSDSNGLSYEHRKTIGSFYGGFPQDSFPSIYHFNENLEKHYWTDKQKSETCAKFKEIVDKDLGGWGLSIYANEENDVKRQLFMNGPSVLTFDGHAVLYCAYDQTGLYYRDSYNSKNLVRITWSNWPSRRRPGKNEYCYLSSPYKNT